MGVLLSQTRRTEEGFVNKLLATNLLSLRPRLANKPGIRASRSRRSNPWFKKSCDCYGQAASAVPQAPRERYALIDYAELRELLGFGSIHDIAEAYRGWVEESVLETGRFKT
jgi:hypothetical protein